VTDRDDVLGVPGDAVVHHAHHDPEEVGSISAAVAEAVATVAGVDPTETRVPLDRSVDPDALDRLFEGEGDAHLAFSVWDLRVVVHDDGHVFVHESECSGR
jgi:hypothetical protein